MKRQKVLFTSSESINKVLHIFLRQNVTATFLAINQKVNEPFCLGISDE